MSSNPLSVRVDDQPATATYGDLLAVGGASVVGLVAIAVLAPGGPIRLAFGVALLLFAPGYVTTSALFPTRAIGVPHWGAGEARDATQGVVERVVYSLGLSLGIVPLLGRLLVATPAGFTARRLLGAVVAFVLVVGTVAAVRRRLTPPSERFSPREAVPSRRDLAVAVHPGSDRATLAFVALGALLVLGSVSAAVVQPVDRGSHSELYLLSEENSTSLQATDYPRQFTAGESREMVVVVENHEGEARNYTIVAQLQRLDEDTGEVVAHQRLGRFASRVADDGTFRRRHGVRPTMTGENLRLAYLMYRGAPPAAPSDETADQTVHLWVTVTDGAGQSSAESAAEYARLDSRRT